MSAHATLHHANRKNAPTTLPAVPGAITRLGKLRTMYIAVSPSQTISINGTPLDFCKSLLGMPAIRALGIDLNALAFADNKAGPAIIMFIKPAALPQSVWSEQDGSTWRTLLVHYRTNTTPQTCQKRLYAWHQVPHLHRQSHSSRTTTALKANTWMHLPIPVPLRVKTCTSVTGGTKRCSGPCKKKSLEHGTPEAHYPHGQTTRTGRHKARCGTNQEQLDGCLEAGTPHPS